PFALCLLPFALFSNPHTLAPEAAHHGGSEEGDEGQSEVCAQGRCEAIEKSVTRAEKTGRPPAESAGPEPDRRRCRQEHGVVLRHCRIQGEATVGEGRPGARTRIRG